jgi:hypothetical protein
MAEYGKLFSSIWTNSDFRKLAAREQQLYCLLISFPTRSLAGVLPLTIKRWANCTEDATEANITEALSALDALRFIVVDWQSEELLVRTFIRNDEVYKQPNLMKACLKDAQKTESTALRQVLQRELLGLPEHRNKELTEIVANKLVETPSEGFPEGISKPSGTLVEVITEKPETLLEPILEGCGVGVTTVSNPPTPTPAASTDTYTEHLHPSGQVSGKRSVSNARERNDSSRQPDRMGRPEMSLTVLAGGKESVPEVPPPDRRANVNSNDPDARAMVAATVPKEILVSGKTAWGLRTHVATLLHNGADPQILERTLRRWVQSSGVYPGDVPHMYAEEVKAAAGPLAPRNAPRLSPVDEKAMSYQRRRQEVEREEAMEIQGELE